MSKTGNGYRVAALAASSAMAMLCAPTSAQIPCRYNVEAIINLAPIGGTDPNVFPLSISPNGQYVVGYYRWGIAQYGWYYEMPDGPLTRIPVPASPYSTFIEGWVYDVNDAGQICGFVRSNNTDVGFVFDIDTQQYTLILLGQATTGQCYIKSINAQGVACGYRWTATGLFGAFVWSPVTGLQELRLIDGLSTQLWSINDNGTVAGWRGQSGSFNDRGITGPPSALEILPPIPGGTASACFAVNAQGVTCGTGLTPSPFGGSDARAFVYDNGVMTLLGVLPGYRRSRAYAIADNGLIAGRCDTLVSNGASAEKAFVWHSGVMRDVDTLVNDPPGMTIYVQSVHGISNDGWLAASGWIAGDEVGLVLSPAAKTGDVTGDCAVNVSDLLLVVNCWSTPKCEGDANGDGFVNVVDLLLVINNWTS